VVATEKFGNALSVIQRLIVIVRKMAYDRVDHERIASVLDDIDYLPHLMIAEEDCTEKFRNHVIGIADSYGWHGLTDLFDGKR